MSVSVLIGTYLYSFTSTYLSKEHKDTIKNNYIEKPFEIVDLKNMLDKILKNKN